MPSNREKLVSAFAQLNRKAVLEYTNLLLSDGMSGEELAREIRATPDGDRVVVMAVTADVENQNNFDMSVFDGILLKPVTKETLAFAFQEMIDKGRITPKG